MELLAALQAKVDKISAPTEGGKKMTNNTVNPKTGKP